MDSFERVNKSNELKIEARRRRVSIMVGILLTVVGASMAFLGLQMGISVLAQFVQQIGFAFLLAGILDLLLTVALDSLREHVTRRERVVMERISLVSSTMESLQKTWEDLAEKQQQAVADLERIKFQHDVQQVLMSLEYEVKNIRMYIDPEYRKQIIEWTAENADRLIKESDEKFWRSLPPEIRAEHEERDGKKGDS